MNKSLYGATLLLWQLNSTLFRRFRNLSFSEKDHLDGIALFVWQLNLILLLYLSYLTSLMKKSLMADAFPSVTQFDSFATTLRCHFLGKRSS